jgi:hypothetical protein
VLARRLYRRQPWLRSYSFKGPLFYDLFLEVNYQIPFDTDGIGDIMSCFFTIPVSDNGAWQLLRNTIVLYQSNR